MSDKVQGSEGAQLPHRRSEAHPVPAEALPPPRPLPRYDPAEIADEFDGAPVVTVTPNNTFSTLAMVFGAIAVLFVPILFGLVGLALGVVAKAKGEPRSTLGLLVPICGTVLGVLFSVLVLHAAA